MPRNRHKISSKQQTSSTDSTTSRFDVDSHNSIEYFLLLFYFL